MSTVAKKKKDSALGRAVQRSRGVTVLQAPQQDSIAKDKSKAKAKDPTKDKEAFEKLRLRVAATLEIYKGQTSIEGPVNDLLDCLKTADETAKKGDWKTARTMITTLEGDTNQLPQMAAEQRDAEVDCRARLKQFNTRLTEYRKLDPKLQDGALLKTIDAEYKAIQLLMTAKSYAVALEQLIAIDRKLGAAKGRAIHGDGIVSGNEDKKRLSKMGLALVERQETLAVKDLEIRVRLENLGEAFDNPAIRALMNEHRNALPGEVNSFKGYRWMDDVQASLDSARAKKDEKAIEGVTKDAQAITKAVRAAKNRQTRMFGLLKGVKETNDNKEALVEARELARSMLSHIPDAWQVEGEQLTQRLPMMLKSGKERENAKTAAMNIPKEQREKETALFKEIIEHGSLKGADRTQFFFDEPLRSMQRDTMDQRAIKRAEEAAELLQEYQGLDENLQVEELIEDWSATISDADKAARDAQAKLQKKGTSAEPDPTIAKALMESTTASERVIKELRDELAQAGKPAKTADSSSQYERLTKMFDKMILRAYAIRDAGGTVTEVESSLEHVPAEFWPPQFIENLQAWRKVERELGEERVADFFEKNKKFSFDDAKDCLSLVMETYGMLANISMVEGAATGLNDEAGWMNVPDVVSLIEGFINEARSGFGNGEEAAKALASLDYSSVKTENLSKLYDNVANTTNTFVNAVINLKFAGIPEESTFMAEVVPVLGAVAAGIDFSVALNALRKAITMRVKTGAMIEEAKIEYYSGKMRDGGAMVKAIKNERGARNRQVAKKGTDVTSKAVILSGEITKSAVGAGWGTEQAVGFGLVAGGKAIEYGGRIVFAGIDWGIADQVKKLIKEAQAGNPIARMELMENSGLYAKMYIAILAKEDHKLALKFVAQRGYDEQSVMKPAVSLKILREAMLAHADQKDETQVADNLGEALAEGLAGKGAINAVKLIGKGAIGLAKKIKDLPKDKKIAYDPAWKPKSPVSLSTTDWQTNKSDCIKTAGLYDESTGIEKSLKPCDEEIKATDAALTQYETSKSRSSEDRDTLIAQVRKTQGTIGKAMDVIVGYYPGSNTGELHQPMADYVVAIRRILGTHSNRLEQRLSDLKLIKSDWTAPTKPGTSAADWKTNWADAAQECDLPKQDGGVGSALEAYEAGLVEIAGLGSDKLKEIHDKRVEIRDSLKNAGLALKSLWSECTSFAGALEYLDHMTDHVLKASQSNDMALNGFDWKDNPAKNFASDPTCFSSAKWKETYEAADKMGFCNQKAKDCGMEKALAAWEKDPMATDPDSVDPKERVKKRKAATKLLAEIAKDAEKLTAANPDSHTEFLRYIAFFRKTAHDKIAEFQSQQDKTTFQVTAGLDSDSWKATYDAGVAVGAIPKDDKAYKELEKTFSSYAKQVAAMEKNKKANKFKDAYADAQKASVEAAGIQKALSHVSNTEGWSNETLNKYFETVRDEAQKESESGKIAEVIGGKNATIAKHPFTFKNKGGWQVVKKEAINAGLTADSKSGFGELIDKYLKAEKNMASAKGKADAYKQSFNVVIAKLKAIDTSAATMEKETKNANYVAYFKDASKQCRDKIAELEKARPA